MQSPQKQRDQYGNTASKTVERNTTQTGKGETMEFFESNEFDEMLTKLEQRRPEPVAVPRKTVWESLREVLRWDVVCEAIRIVRGK